MTVVWRVRFRDHAFSVLFQKHARIMFVQDDSRLGCEGGLRWWAAKVTMKMRCLCPLMVVVGCLFGCGHDGVVSAGSEASTVRAPVRLDSRQLPNLVLVHDRVLSGGLPAGAAAFQELVDRGVRTIISVDGAKPDVATAARFGLRYVHLPHGYDGIPDGRVRELAKAVRELDGPIYIHCHHGKHRSPAAATVACVSSGLLPASQAVSVLQLAGTNPAYTGLFRSVRDATALESSLLDELQVDFKAVVPIPPMAEAMVQLGHTHEHLIQLSNAGWNHLEDHSDLHPAHEALLLREHFTELLRMPDVQMRPADFKQWLRDSESVAEEIEAILANGGPSEGVESGPAEVAVKMRRIATNCKACHRKYRDGLRTPEGS